MKLFISGTGLSCQLLKRLRLENYKFKASPGNFTRLSQNEKVKKG